MLFTGHAVAQQYQYTLGGFSPGGLGSLLGVGVDQAVQSEFRVSTITYQPTGGGFANVALLDQGRIQLGLAHSAEVLTAIRGEEPFKQPIKDIRSLGLLYSWVPMQVLATKSVADRYGLKTFSDIITKKAPISIAVNKPGNIVEKLTEEMFIAAGTSFDDVKQWGGNIGFAASGEQSDLIRDRRVDVVMNNLFVGGSSILEISQARQIARPFRRQLRRSEAAADDDLSRPAGIAL